MRSGQHDTKGPPAHGAILELCAQASHGCMQFAQHGQQAPLADKREVFLGEVETRFDVGKEVQQALAKLVQRSGNAARKLTKRAAPTLLRLTGCDNVMDCLCLCQVELPVQKRPQRELAGPGHPRRGFGAR